MSDRRKSPAVPLTIAVVAIIALIATVVGATVAGTDGDTDQRAGVPSTTSSASPSSPTESEQAPDDGWEQLVRRDADDPMAIGATDAPVVMLAYSEFQCPFCGKYARDTQPTLVEKYVEDGTLRIEWRDFPYLGEESTTAAKAARAAAAQDSFGPFHDVLYENQFPPNSGKLDEDYLVGIAEDLGLDVEQFRADMSSKETADAISRDFAEGQAIGVTGTPAFVINRIPVIGAQPTEVFEEAIERAAEQAAS